MDATIDGRARRWWLLCTFFGAGVIAFVVWFSGVIPKQTCAGSEPPGGSTLLAYQLSRSPEDLEIVFGSAESPCRPEMIAAMDRANSVDLGGFIATYGVFLASFFLAFLRSGAGAVARWGLVAVVAALAFDVLETSTQLYMTKHLPGSATSFTLLALGSTGKFVALAMVCECAGLAMGARASWFGRLAGIACLVGGALVLIGFAHAPSRTALSAGNAIAWLAMLLYAVVAAARPTR